MKASNEQILVIPRTFLFGNGKKQSFQGLISPPDHYFLEIVSAGSFFMPRSKIEYDARYKQLIVYIVLRHANTIFLYRRISGSNEKRLLNKYSLGLGGHINPCRATSFRELLNTNLKRELLEEIYIDGCFSYCLLGIINDDLSEVGLHHLGLVYLVSCSTPKIAVREKNKLIGGLHPVPEVFNCQYQWESWSSLLIPRLKELYDQNWIWSKREV